MRALMLAALLTSAPNLARAQEIAPEGDRALGEYLASECVACHQITGKATGGVPGIVGYPPPAFVIAMQAYKAKERDNKVMQTFAGALSDEEIRALAAYFGSLRPQR
jgi:cytochrome c553